MRETSRYTLAFLDDIFVGSHRHAGMEALGSALTRLLIPHLQSAKKKYEAYSLMECLEWIRTGLSERFLDVDDVHAWLVYRKSHLELAKTTLTLEEMSRFQADGEILDVPANPHSHDQDNYSTYCGMLGAVASFSEGSAKAFQVWLLQPRPIRGVSFRSLNNALITDLYMPAIASVVISGFLRALDHIRTVATFVENDQSSFAKSMASVQGWRMDLIKRGENFVGCANIVVNAFDPMTSADSAGQEFRFEVEQLASLWNRLTGLSYAAAGAS
jgi:hypothetical protein